MKRVVMLSLVLVIAFAVSGCGYFGLGKYSWNNSIPSPIAVGEVAAAPAPVAAPTVAVPAPKVAPTSIIVYFDFDKSNIKASEQAKIEQAVKILKADPTAVVKLGGHTDPFGADDYNMKLGQKRADAVKGALVSGGIDAKRISSASFGETQLVVKDAKSKIDNAPNRRTVVVINIQ
jgi:OOP family OmpA-OmpF porin